MKKILGKLNIVVVLIFAMVISGGLGGVTHVLAGNTATQEASTASATSLEVVGKVADTAVTTITFPQGAPGATISAPYNNVDTVSDAQVLSGTVSEPVVRLKNGSGGTLNVTLQITTWNTIAGFVASEDYELVATTTVNIIAVTSALSTNGAVASVATAIGIPTTEYKALYLELVLGSLAAQSGSSTLTVLGETP